MFIHCRGCFCWHEAHAIADIDALAINTFTTHGEKRKQNDLQKSIFFVKIVHNNLDSTSVDFSTQSKKVAIMSKFANIYQI